MAPTLTLQPPRTLVVELNHGIFGLYQLRLINFTPNTITGVPLDPPGQMFMTPIKFHPRNYPFRPSCLRPQGVLPYVNLHTRHRAVVATTHLPDLGPAQDQAATHRYLGPPWFFRECRSQFSKRSHAGLLQRILPPVDRPLMVPASVPPPEVRVGEVECGFD